MKQQSCFMRRLLLILSLLTPILLSAYDFEADGIYYNITGSQTVEVTSGDVNYEGDVVIPSTVNYNGRDYTVTAIGDRAFDSCSSLTSISIPESVISIGNGAFRDCRDLTSINIPESVTSIGNGAFSGCSLKSVNIPESVTLIGEWAFDLCTNLIEIIVSPNNPNYYSENGILFNKDKTVLIKYPSMKDVIFGINYKIPETVISIGNGAFEGCFSLTSVSIPESVTSIGDYAFERTSLTSINIPESVTSIAYGVFSYCTRLTTVNIPESVTSIGDCAFENCSLESIECSAVTPPSIESSAFSDWCYSNTKLYVPAESIELYKADPNWGKFKTLRDINYHFEVTKCEFFDTPGFVQALEGMPTGVGASMMYNLIPTTEGGRNMLEWESVPVTIDQLNNCRAFIFETTDDEFIECFVADIQQIDETGATTLLHKWMQECVQEIYGYGVERKVYVGTKDANTPFEHVLLTCGGGDQMCILEKGKTYRLNIYFYETVQQLAKDNSDDHALALGKYSMDIQGGTEPFVFSDLALKSVAGKDFVPTQEDYYVKVEGLTDPNKSIEFTFTGPVAMTAALNLGMGATQNMNASPVDPETIDGVTYATTWSVVPGLSAVANPEGGYLPNFNIIIKAKDVNGRVVEGINGEYETSCWSVDCEFLGMGVDLVVSPEDKYAEKLKEFTVSSNVGNLSLVDTDILPYLTSESGEIIAYSSVILNGTSAIISLNKEIIGAGKYDLVIPAKTFSVGADYINNAITIQYIVEPYNPNVWNEVITVSLSAAGTLFNALGLQNIQQIKALKVIGEINGTDVMTLNRMSSLVYLDLSEADIVAGGETYRDELRTNNNIIGSNFFYSIKPQYLILPNSVTTIRENAFSGLSSLRHLEIGASTAEIGDSSFGGCSRLAEVICYNPVPAALAPGAFDDAVYSSAELYVPAESESGYRADAVWSKFAAIRVIPVDIVSLSVDRPEWKGVIGDEFTLTATINPANATDRNIIWKSADEEIASVDENGHVLATGIGTTEITVYAAAHPEIYAVCTVTVNTDEPANWGEIVSVENPAAGNLQRELDKLADMNVRSLKISGNINGTDINAINTIRNLKYIDLSDARIVEGGEAYGNNLRTGNDIVGAGFFFDIRPQYILLPNSAAEIADGSFIGLTSLRHIQIGSATSRIGAYAFAGCRVLSKVVCLNPLPPVSESSTFDSATEASATLLVPKGSLVHYWLDPVWKEFANIADNVLALDAIPAATYGDGEIDLRQYAPEGVELIYETSNPDVVEINGTMMRIVGAGEATIGAIAAENGTPMELMGQMRQFVVNKADLILTLADITIEEGQPMPAFNFIAKGLAYDDTLDDIESLPQPEFIIDENTPPGVYTVTFTEGRDRNYNVSAREVKVTVTRKPSGISGTDADENEVEIFTLGGLLVFRGNRHEAKLGSGVYIVKSGNDTEKITVR